jgi:hypothetical protein
VAATAIDTNAASSSLFDMASLPILRLEQISAARESSRAIFPGSRAAVSKTGVLLQAPRAPGIAVTSAID